MNIKNLHIKTKYAGWLLIPSGVHLDVLHNNLFKLLGKFQFNIFIQSGYILFYHVSYFPSNDVLVDVNGHNTKVE